MNDFSVFNEILAENDRWWNTICFGLETSYQQKVSDTVTDFQWLCILAPRLTLKG